MVRLPVCEAQERELGAGRHRASAGARGLGGPGRPGRGCLLCREVRHLIRIHVLIFTEISAHRCV